MTDFKKENYENGSIEAWSNDLPILKQLETGELINTRFHEEYCKSEPQFSQYLYQPKPKTIMIGDVEITEPISDKSDLEVGERYYYPSLDDNTWYSYLTWGDNEDDEDMLNKRVLHRAEEDAIAHTNAIIKISGGKV